MTQETNLHPLVLEMQRAMGKDIAGPGLRRFQKVPAEELVAARKALDDEVGFWEGITPGLEHIPFVGHKFTRDDQEAAVEGAAAMEQGTATADDERAVLRHVVEQGRERTIGGAIGEGIVGSAQFAAEIAIPGGAAAKLSRGAAALGAAKRGTAAAAMRALGTRAGKAGIQMGLTSAGVEVAPRLFGSNGGQWTVESVRRTMPGIQIDDSDGETLGVFMNDSFAEYLEADNPQLQGFIDNQIELLSERSGEFFVKRLPPLRVLQAAQGAIVGKVIKDRFDGDVGRFLNEAADRFQYAGPVAEMFEERVGDLARAGVPGFEETLADVVPSWRELVVEAGVVTAPGAAGLAVGVGASAIKDRRGAGPSESAVQGQQERAEERAESVLDEGSVPEETPRGTFSGEGPRQPAAEITDEVRAQDVEQFRIDTGADEIVVVEPQSERQRAAAELARELGSEVTFVRTPERLDTPGQHAREGHIILDADAADARAVVTHELVHAVESQVTPQEWGRLVRNIDAIDPEILPRAREAYRARYAEAFNEERAAKLTGERLESEGVASVAQELAGLFEHAGTTRGRRDLETIAEGEPGTFRRIADAVVDFALSLVGAEGQSFAASARRISSALDADTMDAPESAARTALLLRDVMEAAENRRIARVTSEGRPEAAAGGPGDGGGRDTQVSDPARDDTSGPEIGDSEPAPEAGETGPDAPSDRVPAVAADSGVSESRSGFVGFPERTLQEEFDDPEASPFALQFGSFLPASRFDGRRVRMEWDNFRRAFQQRLIDIVRIEERLSDEGHDIDAANSLVGGVDRFQSRSPILERDFRRRVQRIFEPLKGQNIEHVGKLMLAKTAPDRNRWMGLRFFDDALQVALDKVERAKKRTEHTDAVIRRALEQGRKVRQDALDRYRGQKAALTRAENELDEVQANESDAEKLDWAYRNGYRPGSGMTDAEAAADLAAMRTLIGAKKADAFLEEVAKSNSERLAHVVETGLVDEATAAKWHAREPYWVSMRDLIHDEGLEQELPAKVIPGTQPGANQFDRAEGRATPAQEAPLAWFSENLYRIREAEKNAAIARGKGLAEVEGSGIEVRDRLPEDGSGEEAGQFVRFFDSGTKRFLKFDSPHAAAALKTINEEQTGWIIRNIGKLTRLFSRNVTGRNPIFWAPNLIRDSTGALWTISAERSFKDGAQVWARAWRVLPALIKHQVGKETRLDGIIEEAEREGFKTTWSGHQTLEEQLKFLEQSLSTSKPKGAAAFARRTLDVLENVGDAFEMSVRLAAYEYEKGRQIESGKSEETARAGAGLYAKEITVNFDRKGLKTSDIGAIYAFFNPAVQGNARLIRAALSGQRGRSVALATVALGLVMEALNYALSDEDELTGLPEYALIPEWEKDRNVIFPISIGGVRPKVTMPYGLGSIFGLGRRALHLVAGDEIDPTMTRARVIQDGMMQMVNEWNPLGDISNPAVLATPTIFRPAAEIAMNTKFGGRPIMPGKRSFGQTKPDSERTFSTIEDRATGWLAQGIAHVLNLGGPEEVATGLDVSPESIQHLLEFAAASFGIRELDRVSEFALSKREVAPTNTLPVVRQFSTAVQSHSISGLYYEIKEVADWLDDQARDQPARIRRQIAERDPKAWRMRPLFKRASRRLSALRKRIGPETTLTLEEQHEVRRKMTEIQGTLVRLYHQEDDDEN